jgi:putative endonuclease
LGLVFLRQMAFWVYLLRSESTGRLYIGHTSDLQRRLREHNDPELGRRRYTRRQKGPWRLRYSEEHVSRSEAMRRERFLKSGQGREWLMQTVLKEPFNRPSPPEVD